MERKCLHCSKDISHRGSKAIYCYGSCGNLAWAKKNPEKVKDRSKKFHNDNPDYSNNYRSNKMSKDPLYKMRINVSTLISNSLRKRGYTKDSNTANILGTDYTTVFNYLQITFEKVYDVEWSNDYLPHLHLDHVTPLSSASSKEEILRLNHHSNLQYLYKVDNLIKSDRLDWSPAEVTPVDQWRGV